jgi:hypothetical protein
MRINDMLFIFVASIHDSMMVGMTLTRLGCTRRAVGFS